MCGDSLRLLSAAAQRSGRAFRGELTVLHISGRTPPSRKGAMRNSCGGLTRQVEMWEMIGAGRDRKEVSARSYLAGATRRVATSGQPHGEGDGILAEHPHSAVRLSEFLRTRARDSGRDFAKPTTASAPPGLAARGFFGEWRARRECCSSAHAAGRPAGASRGSTAFELATTAPVLTAS